MAAVVQAVVRVVRNREEKDSTIRQNLKRNMELLDYMVEDPFYLPKLVVYPEFCLTGVPEATEGRKGRRLVDYQMASTPIPSEYTDLWATKAVEHGVYMVANTFESDESWPERVFNCSFVIDPKGKIVLKYRKLNDVAGRISNTNPPDIYSEYVKKYGEDAFFPVINTPIGKLACMTCYDVHFPEVARIFAMRGAEVIAMPTGEAYSFGPDMEMMRRVRAFENSVYLVSANHGDTIGSTRPINQQWGHSEIIDYKGRILQVIAGPGEAVNSAQIDLEALRSFKRTAHSNNLLPQVKVQFYSKFYSKFDFWPLDAYLDQPITDKSDGTRVLQKVLQKKEQETKRAEPISR